MIKCDKLSFAQSLSSIHDNLIRAIVLFVLALSVEVKIYNSTK